MLLQYYALKSRGNGISEYQLEPSILQPLSLDPKLKTLADLLCFQHIVKAQRQANNATRNKQTSHPK